MHLSHEKVKQQYSSNFSLDISTNSLYTTNSIYITNIWEEPMLRCLYVKLQPQIDYVGGAVVKNRLGMKLTSGRKEYH
jgi:hypothetical protein